MQVAFDAHLFRFHQREHVGEAERRQRLPEFLPDRARGAQREAVIGRDERPGRDLGHAAFLDAHQRVGLVDGDQEGGVDEAAAPHQIGVGVDQCGEVFEHAFSPAPTAWQVAESGRKSGRACAHARIEAISMASALKAPFV